MLPFTKRPGRDDSDEVFTKDDVEGAVPPPKKSVRQPMPSVSDEELTQLMPSKSLGSAVASPLPAAGRPVSTPPPAAGRPATVPPPRSSNRPPPSVPPPARSSARNPSFLTDDDDDEGRTVIKATPSARVVKRTSPKMGMTTQNMMPTTVSPAAVIKSALDSASHGRRNDLMAPPPADLLEDRADVMPTHPAPEAQASSRHAYANPAPSMNVQPVQPMQPMQPFSVNAVPVAPGSVPQAVPSAPRSHPSNFPGPYVAPMPPGSVSVPGVAMGPSSMPAHFMVPQAPYSDARIDPPGTSITARTKVSGRPAASWAIAALAFGLFVGVGAIAVTGGKEGLVETTASFVDPSRAGAKGAAAQPQPQPAPVPVPVPVPAAEENKVAVPGVTVPAPTVAPATPPAATTNAAPPPVAAAEPPPAPATTADSASGKKTEEKPEKKAASAPASRTYYAPSAKPAAPKPAEKEEVASAAPPAEKSSSKPAKGGKPEKAAGKGGSDVDEETRKALEALQKSQLESSF
jgi:hypothetical protein